MQRDLTLGKRKQPIMRSALGETLRFAEQSEKKNKTTNGNEEADVGSFTLKEDVIADICP